MIKYYLNLTNGIEFLTKNDPLPEGQKPVNVSFLRIQSTACEQKRWEFILSDLDYNFLMDLAVGNTCVVVDYSAKKNVPRAIYQGLEWIKYVLNKVWFDREYKPLIRGHNCTEYFAKEYHKIKKSKAIRKIKYFRKFLNTDKLDIETITGNTDYDSTYDYYNEILQKVTTNSAY